MVNTPKNWAATRDGDVMRAHGLILNSVHRLEKDDQPGELCVLSIMVGCDLYHLPEIPANAKARLYLIRALRLLAAKTDPSRIARFENRGIRVPERHSNNRTMAQF